MSSATVTPPGWVPPSEGPDGASGGWLRLVDANGARLGDEAAIAAGDTSVGLMRRAAGHLARGVRAVAGGRSYGVCVVLVVGKGDNGGDGWAAADLLRRGGMHVTVLAVHDLDAPTSDAAASFRAAWLASGGRTVQAVTGEDIGAALRGADVVVDCLLGTGSSGAPRGVVGQAVEAIDLAGRAGATVVACDVPTGVDADTGAVPGTAVRADLTVTFGACKQGLVVHPGAQHVGRVVVADLGSRYPVLDRGWAVLTAAGALPPLPDAGAEKRGRGVVLAVAGSVGTVGAAALCTRGLLVGGAGLVTVATPEPVRGKLAPMVPAAMTIGLPSKDGAVTAKAGADLDVAAFDAVVAGPGLGHGKGTRGVVEDLLATAPRLVLDADALNVFRDDRGALAKHAGELVVTPHARELARISGHDDAEERRAEVARELADTIGATVVAKGPRTIVASPDGRTWVTPTGSSALATGGTGDVLAGLIGAAVAAATDVPLAVARAVWQHGFAGQWLGGQLAGRLTADVLASRFPEVLHRLDDLARRDPLWPLGPGTPDSRQDRR